MMPGYRHEKVSVREQQQERESIADCGDKITGETNEYTLQKYEELRFEVDFESKVEIQVFNKIPIKVARTR